MWQSFWDWLSRVDFVSWDALSAIGQAVGAIGTLWAVMVALKQGKLAQKQTEYAQKQTDLALQQAEEQRKRAEKAELEAKEALKPELTPRFEYLRREEIIRITFINMKQVPAEIFNWDLTCHRWLRDENDYGSIAHTWSLKTPDIAKFQVPHRLRQGDYCTFEIPMGLIYKGIMDCEELLIKNPSPDFPMHQGKGDYWIYLKIDLLTGQSYDLTFLTEKMKRYGRLEWHHYYLFDKTNDSDRMHKEGECFDTVPHIGFKSAVKKWMEDKQKNLTKNIDIWLPPSYDRNEKNLSSYSWKQAIQKSYDDEKDVAIERLRKVLAFPYHPDTDWLLFLIERDKKLYGYDFEIRPIPKNEDWESIFVDASDNPIYLTNLKDLKFSFSSYRYLGSIEFKDEEEIDEFNEYAESYLCKWFSDRFLEAGGDSFPLPCYIQFEDTVNRFDMRIKEWD